MQSEVKINDHNFPFVKTEVIFANGKFGFQAMANKFKRWSQQRWVHLDPSEVSGNCYRYKEAETSFCSHDFPRVLIFKPNKGLLGKIECRVWGVSEVCAAVSHF